MVDEFYELIVGESGFVVEVRCNYSFNDDKYSRIKIILSSLVEEWKRYDNVPKKAMLAIVELMICLVGGNRFLSEEEMMKLEDASIEINGLLNCLYKTI